MQWIVDRRVRRLGCLLLLVAAGLAVAPLARDVLRGYYRITTLRPKRRTELVLYGAVWCQGSQKLYYAVYDGWRLVTPPTPFGGQPPDASTSFRLVQPTGGSVVGVVEAAAPDIVLVLYDTQTRQSWPPSMARENGHAAERLASGLLAQLNAGQAGRLYLLSSDGAAVGRGTVWP